MDKMTKEEGSSLDMVNGNLERLKSIFPEAFTEDGVDFDVLRQLLGDDIAEGEEKYGLNWFGKKKARQIALTPSMGTLRPCKKESVDWDTTKNLFIEGDNLEVLKLLQKSYANKVKMIYIDPPYNTGKEFIYPDKFQDNLDTYLRYTKQKDDEGLKTSSNAESSGRYHTNWLNMMYPRLKLARNLLTDDGVIFISIDNNEIHNLRKICDEVFGEENLIESFIWDKKNSAKGVPPQNMVVNVHEYILCYSKSGGSKLVGELRTTETFSNPDNDPRGPWRLSNIKSTLEREKDKFSILDPETGNEFVNYWAFSKISLERMIAENRIIFPKSPDGLPKQKEFFNKFSNPYIPIMSQLGIFHSQDTAEKAIDKMMEIKSFLYRKPLNLIKKLISQGTNFGDVVLDFFSGSATTAHAMMQLNSEDDGKRKFIMVQLPEPTSESSEAYKAGYKNIADIGKERIRRATTKIREENPMFAGDLGFKVFKLDSSNIRAWNPDRHDLEQTLLDHTEHLIEGRSEEDVLYELLLKRGVDLTVPIEEKTIMGKTVYSIGYGVLFACLAPAVGSDEVEILAQGIIDWHKELEPASDTQVVFRDSAFADDIAKTNISAILEQHGIAHVRSL